MKTKVRQRAKMQTWQRLLIIALALIIVGTALGYAVNTNFGSVTVRDMSFVTDSGVALAGTLYIPEGASAETPAPAVVVQHGGNCNRETMSSFSVELARRGYIVFNEESWGNGYSDVNHNDTIPTTVYATQYLKDLAIVDGSRIGLIGHSAGAAQVCEAALYNDMEFGVRSVLVTGAGATGFDADTPINLGFIIGYRDENHKTARIVLQEEGNKAIFGTTEDIVDGQWYGSIEDHTARVMYNPEGVFHLMMRITPSVIATSLDFFNRTFEYDPGIASSDQIWWPKELGSCMVFAAVILVIFAMILSLPSTRLLAPAVVSETRPQVRRGVKFYVGIAIVALFSGLGLQAMFAKGVELMPMISSAFQLSLINGAVLWAVAVGLCMIIVNTIIKRTTKGYDFAEESRVYRTAPVNVLRIIAAALAIFAVCFLITALVQTLSGGMHTKFLHPEFSVLNVARFGVFALYLWPFLLGQLIAAYVQTTTFRTVGGSGKSFLFTTMFVNAIGLLIYLVIIMSMKSFGVSFGDGPIIEFLGLVSPKVRYNSVALSIVMLSFVNSGITVTAYKKTGTIYLGSLINAMLLTWMACGGVLGEVQ